MKVQVEKNHYKFVRYVNKKRWSSMWHQLDDILALEPHTVLEVGPGPGLLKGMLSSFNIKVETVDIDAEVNPDHIAPATKLPFDDNQYDVVCAFQMLEHLPYQESLVAFSEMVRVSKSHIVISLPDAKKLWRYIVYIPKIGEVQLFLPRPRIKTPIHKFDGQHYWELNKKGYSLDKVVEDLVNNNGVRLLKTYRVKENTYHRFFVFSKA